MSQSKLVTYTQLTTHFGYPDGAKGRQGKKIDKIFVHHMAGNLTVQQCGNVFKTREASAHYGVDGKGRVGQYVLEENAAWHCANKAYSLRSIAIELANDGGASTNWHVSDKTIAKAIDLIVDICQRNDIKKLNYTGDLSGNLCMHCWTASTACPGGYMKTKFKYIAEQVNKKLTGSTPTPTPTPAKKVLYRVRKSWTDAKSQVGAFVSLANAKKVADEYKLNVYDNTGKLVYSAVPKPTPKPKTQIYRVRKTWANEKSQVGAYKVLANAKKECDKHAGYSVFDESGKAVYKSKKKDSVNTKIAKACEEQTEWSYKSVYEWQGSPTIAKSKTKSTCVTYVACVFQRLGVLKSGQYIWHNGSGFGTGKVTGATKNFNITYYNNKKTLKDIKSTLKLGDVLMYDDSKSGVAGNGGHTEIYKGTGYVFYTGGTGSYHNTSNNHTEKSSRKVLAVCRVKDGIIK